MLLFQSQAFLFDHLLFLFHELSSVSEPDSDSNSIAIAGVKLAKTIRGINHRETR